MDQDPKGKRIYNPKAEAKEQLEPMAGERPKQPKGSQQVEPQPKETVLGEGGGCPT
ncbi:hypothetical protein PIB30_073840 [Stylosanthes scabra]|uniref:Uncharacterized protein n=1 Tax=Stylosanthes scabra TaxID=79078 RepID=A0ABU6UN83_9FABA|nr:hypothetical protein [Stylosanthes scabra]